MSDDQHHASPSNDDEQRRLAQHRAPHDPHHYGRVHNTIFRTAAAEGCLAVLTPPVLVASLCALSAINGFQWMNYSPIAQEAQRFYGLDTYQLNLLPTMYMVCYVPLCPLALVAIQKWGSHGCLLLGGALNMLGALCKYIATVHVASVVASAAAAGGAAGQNGGDAAPPDRSFPTAIGFIFLGQILAAASEVFFLPLPPIIASTWFAANRRTLVTSIGVMANSVGIAIGFLIPPLLIGPTRHDPSTFSAFFSAQFWFCVAIMVWIVLMPAKPCRPPSVTAAPPIPSFKETCPAVKRMVCNRPFLLLALSTGLANDSLWVIASFLAQLLLPFNITEVQSGWIAFAMTLSGIVSATALGIYVDHHRVYKPPMLWLTVLAVSSLGCLTLSLIFSRAENSSAESMLVYVVGFFITLMGMALSASIPIQLEYAIELTYPNPETVVMILFSVFSAVLSPVISTCGTAYIGESPTKKIIINFMLGAMLLASLATITLLFVPELYHRVKRDLQHGADAAVDVARLQGSGFRLQLDNSSTASDEGSDVEGGIARAGGTPGERFAAPAEEFSSSGPRTAADVT